MNNQYEKKKTKMLHRENKIRTHHTTCAADLIKETMDYNKITPEQLAEKSGVSLNIILNILSKKQFLDNDLASKIGKALRVSEKLLLNLDKDYQSNRK